MEILGFSPQMKCPSIIIIRKNQKTPLCQKPLVFEHFKTRGFESYQKAKLSEAIRIPCGILRFNAEMNGGFL